MNTEKLFSMLEKSNHTEFIKGEIYLTERPDESPFRNYLHKTEAVIGCICTRGELRGHINLKPVHLTASCMLIALSGQLLQFENPSDDFQGMFIIMSKQFTEKLNLAESVPTYLSVRNSPLIPLDEHFMEGVTDYFKTLKKVLSLMEDEFCKIAVVKHLTVAYFYGLGYLLHKLSKKERKSRGEIIMDEFLKLVQKHYKEERSLEFYADKLCITSKYLSISVKNNSGKSAREWVDDYVTLEARNLLQSTELSVQQISEELHFPSQSFFGKFFKRQTGISPRQFRQRL